MAPKSASGWHVEGWPRYTEWKGRLLRNSWEKWHEELWFVAKWSSGWSDWETADQHLSRLPLTPDQKLQVVVQALERSGAQQEGGEPLTTNR